jgi:hypothetical protein
LCHSLVLSVILLCKTFFWRFGLTRERETGLWNIISTLVIKHFNFSYLFILGLCQSPSPLREGWNGLTNSLHFPARKETLKLYNIAGRDQVFS